MQTIISLEQQKWAFGQRRGVSVVWNAVLRNRLEEPGLGKDCNFVEENEVYLEVKKN